MNRLILLFAFIFFLTNCKNDEPGTVPEVAGIVGTWYSVEMTDSRRDSVITKAIPRGQADIIVFRFDGVMVGENGVKACCSPDTYVLNGVPFTPKPLAPLPTDGSCANVLCLRCGGEYRISQTSPDTLLVEFCGMSVRYNKLKD